MVSDISRLSLAASLLWHTCSPYCLMLAMHPWLQETQERLSLALEEPCGKTAEELPKNGRVDP